MRILNVIDEDIVNYKKISMYIAFPYCSMKCNIDANKEICQNIQLLQERALQIDGDELIKRYLANPLSKAIVLGGLEPLDSKFDLIPFIDALRNKYKCHDDVVIYTGYTEEELNKEVPFSYKGCEPNIVCDLYTQLKNYDNIIIKYGRYIENNVPHYDEVLGIKLASDNQYAKIL